jgi:hypothetical protein
MTVEHQPFEKIGSSKRTDKPKKVQPNEHVTALEEAHSKDALEFGPRLVEA